MTTYGYVRLSKEDANNLTISTQIDRMLELGIRREHIFVDDGKSGGVKEENITRQWKDNRYHIITIDLFARTDFCKLRNIIKPGDELVMTRWDRLSRHNVFLADFCDMCEATSIKVYSLDENNDRLVRTIMTVIAEQEIRKTALRTKSVQQQVYATGGWPFRAPTGYFKNSKENGLLKHPDKEPNSLIIDPPKAALVKRLFERMATGENYSLICADHHLDSSTLYAIIKNRVYRGETHLADDWKPTPLIPILVDERTWQHANNNIKSKPKRGERAL